MTCTEIETQYRNLIEKYDENGDGLIDIPELMKAIGDYNAGLITLAEEQALESFWRQACVLSDYTPPPRYECDRANFECIETPDGRYMSLADCQKTCLDIPPPPPQNCVSWMVVSGYLRECPTQSQFWNQVGTTTYACGVAELPDPMTLPVGTIIKTDCDGTGGNGNGTGGINLTDLGIYTLAGVFLGYIVIKLSKRKG